MQPDPNRLVIRELPWMFWFFSLGGIVFGLLILFEPQGGIAGFIGLLLGLVGLIFSNVTTLTLDKSTRRMELRYRSPLRVQVKEIPLEDILAIDMESSRSSRGGSTFRIVFFLRSGERVPLHSYFSSGWNEKHKKIERLRAFIGLEAVPTPELPDLLLGTPLSFVTLREGTTAGAAWRLERGSYATLPVMRWVWQGWQYYGRFLFLHQKPATVKASSGGWLGKVSGLLYRQALSQYGIQPDDLPNLDLARLVSLEGTPLAENFAAFTCEPADLPLILTPWAASAINRCLQRREAGKDAQLAVLFAEKDLYVMCLSGDDSLASDLIALGEDLAREARPPA